MIEQIQKMKTLLEEGEKVELELRQSQDGVWEHLAKILPDIIGVYQQFVELVNNGVEIPIDVLIQQLENFETAYGQKDMVVLADTLEYEIKEGICFYIEILKCMG